MTLTRLAGGLTLLFFLTAGAAQESAHFSVGFKKSATVNSMNVSVGDLLDYKDDIDDPVLIRRLNEIVVTSSPRAGYVKLVRKRELLPLLEKAQPGISRRLVWIGKEEVEVSLQSTVYLSANYLSVAKNALLDALDRSFAVSKGNSQLEVSPVGELRDIYLPQGEVTVKAKTAENNSIKSRMCVWVDIFLQGKHYQSVPVWFRVKLVRDVLVASKDLQKGDVFGANDAVLSARDVAKLGGDTVAIVSEIEGMRLKQSIASGREIVRQNLEKMPDVIRGANVKVLAKVGAISIETVAVALEDGFVGDNIDVQNRGGDEKYKALVVGNMRVEVGEGY